MYQEQIWWSHVPISKVHKKCDCSCGRAFGLCISIRNNTVKTYFTIGLFLSLYFHCAHEATHVSHLAPPSILVWMCEKSRQKLLRKLESFGILDPAIGFIIHTNIITAKTIALSVGLILLNLYIRFYSWSDWSGKDKKIIKINELMEEKTGLWQKGFLAWISNKKTRRSFFSPPF